MVPELEKFVKTAFGVDLNIFTQALMFSPNAQGYVDGAISEFVLKEYLESQGYVVERILEKWKGKKPIRHHGDFYIRRANSNKWYVLELKGLKSNSEEWHELNDKNRLLKFLRKYNKYLNIFSSDEEIIDWCEKNFESDLNKIKIRVLETHFVARKDKRKINTSRKDEFDYIAVDLFLRTGKHEFIFARPEDLPSAEGYPEHLQQNYVIDILLYNKKEDVVIQPPWHKSLDEIFDETKEPIKVKEMQINDRAKRPGIPTGPWLLKPKTED
jgi:hypothetical protein